MCANDLGMGCRADRRITGCHLGFQPKQLGEWRCHLLKMKDAREGRPMAGRGTPELCLDSHTFEISCRYPSGPVRSPDSELKGDVRAGYINWTVRNPWEILTSVSRIESSRELNLASDI